MGDTQNESLLEEDYTGQIDVSPELVDAYLFRLPRAYTYADYIWPGLLMSPDRLKSLADFEFKPTDILICSYPKSGTTWVSEVISLICHRGDVDEVKRLPMHDRVPWLEMDNSFAWIKFFWFWQVITKFVGLGQSEDAKPVTDPDDNESTAPEDTFQQPRVFFTHLPLELLPTSAVDGNVKIIYIARNPKDTAVSFFHFHQMARYLGLQKMNWNEFFPLFMVGKIYCGSWFEHVSSFWKFSRANPNVLFLQYENMKKNLHVESQKICDFVNIKLSHEVLDRVVRHCSFNTMKDNRMANRDGVWLFDQNISKFMRKGTVGDWKNYLSVAQNDMFDRVYAVRMKQCIEQGLHFEFEFPTTVTTPIVTAPQPLCKSPPYKEAPEPERKSSPYKEAPEPECKSPPSYETIADLSKPAPDQLKAEE